MTRILLYFFFGIALPSGLLGYLAFRGIQNDRALVERERRGELERIASEARGSFERRIEDAAQALPPATSLQPHGGLGSDDATRAATDRPWIESVFTIEPDGAVTVVASKSSLRFRSELHAAPPGADPPEWSAALDEARRRELRSRDPEGALLLYERALELARDERTRGETLIGIARVQRKLGRLADADRTYRLLRSEHAQTELAGGMPAGPAAGIEHAAVLLESGDSAGAGLALRELLADVSRGRWLLTPAQFDFVTAAVLESLGTLAASRAYPWPADSLDAWEDAVRVQRDGAMATLALEGEVGRLAASGELAAGSRTISADGRVFHAVFVGAATGSGPVRSGFAIDVRALTTAALAEALGGDRADVTWVVRRNAQAIAASSAAADADAPVSTTELPGFPEVTTELGYAPDRGGSFLTSRRAVYLYAFVLLAGILAFGLTLTIRSVGRELELARLKSDFASTVSHELRSPLTAIRQMSEMLRDGRVASEERRRRYYDALVEQSERLSTLVDDVLDSARLEAGKRRMRMEPLNVERLIEETVSDARQRVIHPGFDIRSEIVGALPALALDGEAIRQALRNLIDNGVKYAGTSRELIVRGYRDDGQVVISVQDFGIGIPSDEADKVFERFYRGGHELTRTVKGTGLGLTLVKQIVEAHGGTVQVASQPGRGSIFSMRFPGRTPAAPTERGPA